MRSRESTVFKVIPLVVVTTSVAPVWVMVTCLRAATDWNDSSYQEHHISEQGVKVQAKNLRWKNLYQLIQQPHSVRSQMFRATELS